MTTHALRGRTRYPGQIDPRMMSAFPLVRYADLDVWVDFSDPDTLYTDAGTTNVSSDGDAIYQADDKSGKITPFTQATLSKRPLYRPALDAGEFDGVDDILKRDLGPDNNKTSTSFAVINLSNTSQSGCVFGFGNDSAGYFMGVGGSSFDNSGNDLIILFGARRWIDTGDLIGTGKHLLTLEMYAGIPSWYIDGVYSGTSPTGLEVYTPNNYTVIGGEYDRRYFTDHILEVVSYATVLTESERDQLHDYLMTKHGIS